MGRAGPSRSVGDEAVGYRDEAVDSDHSRMDMDTADHSLETADSTARGDALVFNVGKPDPVTARSSLQLVWLGFSSLFPTAAGKVAMTPSRANAVSTRSHTMHQMAQRTSSAGSKHQPCTTH